MSLLSSHEINEPGSQRVTDGDGNGDGAGPGLPSVSNPARARTATEVAELLALSPEFVRKRASSGEWPCRRYGRRIIFLPEDLEAIKELGRSRHTEPITVARIRRRRAQR